MWMLLSCASVLCPLCSQDQLSTLWGWKCGFVLAMSFLLGSLTSTSFLGLIPQYANMLLATIFRNSENETHSHRMIQPLNCLVLWTQVSQMLTSNAYISLYRTLMAALFITGRTWKQPRCPSGGEWTHRLGFIHQQDVLQWWKVVREMASWGDRWGTFSAYYSLKEANLEKRQSSGYQLPGHSRKGKPRKGWKDQCIARSLWQR